MKLQTLWKCWNEDGNDNNVELLFALDEYTVENNYEAWTEGVKAACAAYGIEESETRVAYIEIDLNAIAVLFAPAQTTGRVMSEGACGHYLGQTGAIGVFCRLPDGHDGEHMSIAQIASSEKPICPDGGTCHHSCLGRDCFRVRTCAPLSGVYADDEWPEGLR